MAVRDQLLNLMPSSFRRPLRDLLDIAKPSSATAASITDSSGGTASQTIASITGGGANCENATKNAIASLADDLNKVIADVEDLRSKVATLTGT